MAKFQGSTKEARIESRNRFIAENGFQFSRTVFRLPGHEYESVERFWWPRAVHGGRYDVSALLLTYRDGSWDVFLSDGACELQAKLEALAAMARAANPPARSAES